MSGPETISDQPIDARYHEQMKVMAEVIDEWFNGKPPVNPREVGFVLLLFPFADHAGRCNYLSNARREDIIVLLKDQLRRFEGGAYQEGHS